MSASSSITCAFLTRFVTEDHRDFFFFFGMLQFYLESSVSLNVCDMTGTQNKFTDTNLDIAGAFVAKAPLSHWPTTEILLRISWSLELPHFCYRVWALMSGLVWLRPHCRAHCPFAVRRKLKACGTSVFAGASFVFKVMVVLLLTLNFDFSFSIDLLFPHKIPSGLEMNLGWLSRSVWAELAAYSGLPHGTSLHTVALDVAQQNN